MIEKDKAANGMMSPPKKSNNLPTLRLMKMDLEALLKLFFWDLFFLRKKLNPKMQRRSNRNPQIFISRCHSVKLLVEFIAASES